MGKKKAKSNQANEPNKPDSFANKAHPGGAATAGTFILILQYPKESWILPQSVWERSFSIEADTTFHFLHIYNLLN